MEIVLKEGSNENWVYWVYHKSINIKNVLRDARIKKDGYFYKKDTDTIRFKLKVFYSILTDEFEDEEAFREEREIMLSHLTTMKADQFSKFATIILEPYTKLDKS